MCRRIFNGRIFRSDAQSFFDQRDHATLLKLWVEIERHVRLPRSALRPKQASSGERRPELRITKAGDRMLRRLLVGSALEGDQTR